MKAHGPACCQHRWRRGALGGVVFAVLGALMPKCPMCIAAWLGVIGLSGLAARVDPRGLWLAGAAAMALAAALAFTWFTRIRKGEGR